MVPANTCSKVPLRIEPWNKGFKHEEIDTKDPGTKAGKKMDRRDEDAMQGRERNANGEAMEGKQMDQEKPGDTTPAAQHPETPRKLQGTPSDEGLDATPVKLPAKLQSAGDSQSLDIPRRAGTITFQNGATIIVDSCNARYFSKAVGAKDKDKVRFTWGGKGHGFPKLADAWRLALKHAGLSPDDDEVQLALQRLVQPVVRRPSTTLEILQKSTSADDSAMPALSNVVHMEVEAGLRDRRLDLEVVLLDERQGVDKWSPGLLGISPADTETFAELGTDVEVPAAYRQLRPRLRQHCVYDDGDGEMKCWVGEAATASKDDPMKKVLGTFCTLCTKRAKCTPGEKAWHTSTLVGTLKTQNHQWQAYNSHQQGPLHLNAVKQLGKVKGPLNHHFQTATEAPAPKPTDTVADEDALYNQVYLYLSCMHKKKSVEDFGIRLQEEQALHPGSVGQLEGNSYRRLASEFSDGIDEALLEDIADEIASSKSDVCTNADEPRGVDRVGLRYTFLDKNYRLTRRFHCLAQLEPVEIAGEGHSKKSAQGIAYSMEKACS